MDPAGEIGGEMNAGSTTATIGLLSDVHATSAPVAEALAIFDRAGVDEVWCAGDIAGYRDELEQTVELLSEGGVRAVHGNHDLRYLAAHKDEADRTAAWLARLPTAIDSVIGGRRVYMVHAEPPEICDGGGIRLLDSEGRVRPKRAERWRRTLPAYNCDVLVVGHTHQVFAEQLGSTMVINPGSSAFNHSCAILHLPAMSVEIIALSNRAVLRYWNWSEYMKSIGTGGGVGQDELSGNNSDSI